MKQFSLKNLHYFPQLVNRRTANWFRKKENSVGIGRFPDRVLEGLAALFTNGSRENTDPYSGISVLNLAVQAVQLKNPLRDGQTQSAARAVSGLVAPEKGFKQAGELVGWDGVSVVVDGKDRSAFSSF